MADFVLRRLIHRAMGGQRDHINRHPASTFAQALGHQLGQEGIDVAFERIQVAALAGQVPQQVGPEGAPSNWSQAWCPESLAAAAKTTHSRSRLCMAPGIVRGQVPRVRRVLCFSSPDMVIATCSTTESVPIHLGDAPPS
jgi:hypothetical protein